MIKDIFGHEYTRIIKDPTFEARLKNFDPNLRLLFDQTDKRFKILEKRPDNSGWNIIVSLLPGEELDQNILNLLWTRRKEYQDKNISEKPLAWHKSFISEANNIRSKIDSKSSENHKHRLMDDRISWRKAAREIRNFPASDVTAGYPKINHKPKGDIICVKK